MSGYTAEELLEYEEGMEKISNLLEESKSLGELKVINDRINEAVNRRRYIISRISKEDERKYFHRNRYSKILSNLHKLQEDMLVSIIVEGCNVKSWEEKDKLAIQVRELLRYLPDDDLYDSYAYKLSYGEELIKFKVMVI